MPSLSIRAFVFTSLVSLTACALDEAASEPTLVQHDDGIAGEYIVVLADTHGKPQDDTIDRLASRHGAAVGRRYRSALRGFSARMTADAARALAGDPDVLLVEKDAPVHASVVTQNNPVYGLDRIDQRALPLDGRYVQDGQGEGTTVFVIDTGIRSDHVELAGRIQPGASAIDDGFGTEDCNGHGTHVAGSIAATTFGVAKKAQVVPIRVLDCQGSGSNAGVIAGIDFVAANHPARSVANMSLGGPASAAVDQAIRNATAAGVTMVVAAGNETQDACNVSPAREPAAITVGATNQFDDRAGFSNFGSCVDIFAPGEGILSLGIDSPFATATLSGTSMASPHVAGAAALFVSKHPEARPADVAASLIASATRDVVFDTIGSPNRLLHTTFTSVPGDDPAPAVPLAVTITSPGDGAIVPSTFDVLVTLGGEGLTELVVGLDGAVLGSLVPTGAQTGFTLEQVPPGDHVIELVLVDSENRTAETARSITVSSGTGPIGPGPGNGTPPAPVDSDEPGGCSTGGGSSTFAFAALLVGLVLRRRRLIRR